MIKSIEFRAIISPIMSGIRVGSDMMRVSFDISKSDLQDAIPLLALTDTVLKLTVEVDNGKPKTEESKAELEKPKKEKSEKEPSPYGEYWRLMVVKGVKNHPDLPEVLDCTEDDVWESLHRAFETDSMSTVSPRTWEAWVHQNGLSEGLITMSRNAEVQAAQKT